MVGIGTRCGRNVSAVLSNMDIPLGHNIGNALEIIEAVDVLRGGGPEDLRRVSLTLAAEMVSLSRGIDAAQAYRLAESALSDGSAYRKALEWIGAQGGDVAAIEDTGLLPQASASREVRAEQDGYIASMDAEEIGRAAMVLGAGRATKDDEIDFSAGIRLEKKTGDFVRAGDTLAILYTSSGEKLDDGERRLRASLIFSEEAPAPQPLVYRVIRG